MKNRKLLAVVLLSLTFCFVSGAWYGEIPEWMFESSASYIDLALLEGTVRYMMAKPYDFLRVSYYYDLTGRFAERFPAGVRTKDKVYISIIDSRNVSSYKFGKTLLDQFAMELFPAYNVIRTIATDMNNDIVAAFISGQVRTIGYFYEGEYYLREE